MGVQRPSDFTDEIEAAVSLFTFFAPKKVTAATVSLQ
jgi:hypothetical protein